MIEMLPAANLLNEAMLNDPEIAAEIAAQPEPDGPKPPWHPRLSEYKLDHILLRELLGSVNALTENFVAANGGSPKPHKPFPVPYTEVDRIREAEDRQFIVDIAGLFGFGPEDLF